MIVNRRTVLAGLSALAAKAAGLDMVSIETATAKSVDNGKSFRKIATEEAFCIPEVADLLSVIAKSGWDSPDMGLVELLFGPNRPEIGAKYLEDLMDFEDKRLQLMDESEVDMQLLSLTAPGVQMFDSDTATNLAQLVNDRLAEVVRRHPDRFAGLACFAPQDPSRAVKEMERAINTLKLHGFIVNSHTNSEYLDQEKYWPILEAAESLDAAIYIHPRAPSINMAAPFRDYDMLNAAWGYGVDAGTHAVRIILSGVLDRFPRLKIVIGHMGEAIPFWLWRLDDRAGPSLNPRIKMLPSEYFKRNFAITTSGVEHYEALKYCIDVLGPDKIMWAVDYPYQPLGRSVQFMNTVPISDTDKEKIYHGNAERIFHIHG